MASYLVTKGTEASENGDPVVVEYDDVSSNLDRAPSNRGSGEAPDDAAVHVAEYDPHGVENSSTTLGEAGVSVT